MKRKRRIRSPHPGVVLLEREGKKGTSWRARYVDPDTGKTIYEPLDRRTLSTKEVRIEWAKKKSKQLGELKQAIRDGVRIVAKTILKDEVDEFLAHATNGSYQYGIGRFAGWALKQRLFFTQDLAPHHLAQFREFLRHEKKTGSAKKGRRGEREAVGEPLARASVNSYLRSVKVFINHLRRLGKTPKIDRDAIGDRLKAVSAPKPKGEYYSAEKCQRIIEAVLLHDQASFRETRVEHAGAGKRGNTFRYDAFSPFVAFVMLTGCRVSEARNLLWSRVKLDVKDESGNKVGEIRLRAEDTKTQDARDIDLTVCPSLRIMLEVMSKRKAGDYVFGGDKPVTKDKAKRAKERVIDTFGAPHFGWQALRRNCGSWLTCAPSIFGAASAYRSAKQLGHSVTIAERYYVGVIRGIPRSVTTLDQALGVVDLLDEVVEEGVCRGG